jgi:hypothetical protein
MNQTDIKGNSNDPANQPHGTTEDQVNEMESEGQATKQGQEPNPSVSGTGTAPEAQGAGRTAAVGATVIRRGDRDGQSDKAHSR